MNHGSSHQFQTYVQVVYPQLCKESQAAVKYDEQSDTDYRPVWAGNDIQRVYTTRYGEWPECLGWSSGYKPSVP